MTWTGWVCMEWSLVQYFDLWSNTDKINDTLLSVSCFFFFLFTANYWTLTHWHPGVNVFTFVTFSSDLSVLKKSGWMKLPRTRTLKTLTHSALLPVVSWTRWQSERMQGKQARCCLPSYFPSVPFSVIPAGLLHVYAERVEEFYWSWKALSFLQRKGRAVLICLRSFHRRWFKLETAVRCLGRNEMISCCLYVTESWC